jgi:hypothetical protein
MIKYKQAELIDAVQDDTIALPEGIQKPSISITVGKPFYGYKKARVNLASVIMDVAMCSADSAYDILHRAGRKSAFNDMDNNPLGEAIVTLEIPAGAKCVIGIDHAKCRCDSAKVVDIRPVFCESYKIVELARKILSDQHVAFKCEPEEGGARLRTAYTNPPHGEQMTYSVGDFVKPVFDFNDDPSMVCASGIHFFLHKNKAIVYRL